MGSEERAICSSGTTESCPVLRMVCLPCVLILINPQIELEAFETHASFSKIDVNLSLFSVRGSDGCCSAMMRAVAF